MKLFGILIILLAACTFNTSANTPTSDGNVTPSDQSQHVEQSQQVDLSQHVEQQFPTDLPVGLENPTTDQNIIQDVGPEQALAIDMKTYLDLPGFDPGARD